MSRFAPGGGRVTPTPGGGSGDVVGPASATASAVAVYSGTTGKLIANSSVTIIGNQLLAPAGSQAAPSIAVGTSDIGMFSPGAGQLALATENATIVAMSTTNIASNVPIAVPAGAFGAPSLQVGPGNNGLYAASSTSLGLSANGTSILTLSAASTTSTSPILSPAGSASVAGVGIGEAGSGFYLPISGTLGVTVGGSSLLTMSSAAIVSAVPIVAIAGTSLAPGLAVGETDSGLYLLAPGNLGVVADSTLLLRLSSTSILTSVPVVTVSGSANAVAIGIGDVDSGFYRTGSGSVGIACNGTLTLNVTPAAIALSAPLSLALSSNGAPSLFFAGSPTTGIASGGSDVFNVVSSGTTRVTVNSSASTIYSPGNQTLAVADAAVTSSVPIVIPAGGNNTPSLAQAGNLDTGIYFGGSGDVRFTTNGTTRLILNGTASYLYSPSSNVMQFSDTRLQVSVPFFFPEGYINSYGTVGSPFAIPTTDTGGGYYTTGTGVQAGYILPASSTGLVYKFLSTTAFGLSIVVNGGGDSFNIGGSVPAGAVTTTVNGAWIEFSCVGSVWYCTGLSGAWSY